MRPRRRFRGICTPARPTCAGEREKLPTVVNVQRLARLLLSGLLFGASPVHADLETRVAAELQLRNAIEAEDRAAVRAMYTDTGMPGTIRGMALWYLCASSRPPVSAKDRAELLRALQDPDVEVRRAGLRAVGRLRDRPLEREALKRAAEDQDPGVRVEALQAVRGWSRLGHLFFLDQALQAPWARVRAEALVNLGRISLLELPPQVVSRVRELTGPESAPQVRLRALEALRNWDRLDWSMARDVLTDREAPEALRSRALRLADDFAPGPERDALLLDILTREQTSLLAWEAYRKLQGSSVGDGKLASAVARYVVQARDRNAATEEMAAFLRNRGYRVAYRAGRWNVAGP